MKNAPDTLPRFTVSERTNHWLVAITFFLSALSGLALFHPFFYPLNQLFGGGVWTRIIHPFFGVVIFLFFCGMFIRFRKLCAMTPADWEWLGHYRELVNADERNLPEAGKLNGGQKMLFWLLAACMALLILSGLVMWRAYFSFLFPLTLVRLASVVHAAAGWAMVALIIGHIYMAIWTRESMDAMIYGVVRKAWAKQHHPLWFRDMTGGDE
jgi:formate dehydrogenase subunit gamma